MLNRRSLIKKASQLGATQASHKETHSSREVGETRCVREGRECVFMSMCQTTGVCDGKAARQMLHPHNYVSVLKQE